MAFGNLVFMQHTLRLDAGLILAGRAISFCTFVRDHGTVWRLMEHCTGNV